MSNPWGSISCSHQLAYNIHNSLFSVAKQTWNFHPISVRSRAAHIAERILPYVNEILSLKECVCEAEYDFAGTAMMSKNVHVASMARQP